MCLRARKTKRYGQRVPIVSYYVGSLAAKERPKRAKGRQIWPQPWAAKGPATPLHPFISGGDFVVGGFLPWLGDWPSRAIYTAVAQLLAVAVTVGGRSSDDVDNWWRSVAITQTIIHLGTATVRHSRLADWLYMAPPANIISEPPEPSTMWFVRMSSAWTVLLPVILSPARL